jgi:hypothetical protein
LETLTLVSSLSALKEFGKEDKVRLGRQTEDLGCRHALFFARKSNQPKGHAYKQYAQES